MGKWFDGRCRWGGCVHFGLMMWFEELMGFDEQSPDQVRANCSVQDELLVSHVNGCRFRVGEFEIASLADLRSRSTRISRSGTLQVSELVGNVSQFHQHKENEGAVFQVASQFNLLEMVNPGVTPEQGVGIYQYDATQGPVCAMACGAGTIFRNYFVPVNGQVGQSQEYQVDCLSGVGALLGNIDGSLWRMKNGYALASESGLQTIGGVLNTADPDELRAALQVGIHWGTEVTWNGCGHDVAQVYGSALPVAYSGVARELWEPFARMVLEASYEASLRAAMISRENTGNRRVFLTLLGGGAFGNDTDWIIEAIRRALRMIENTDLKVYIVSYGSSRAEVANLAEEFN